MISSPNMRWLAHFDGGLSDDLQTTLAAVGVVRQMSDAVFDHDHRAIDNQAKVDGTQAEQAGSDAKAVHPGKGEQHRERNGQRHDRRRPQIAEKRKEHGDDQQSAFEQILPHRVNDKVNQLRAVIDGLDLDVAVAGWPPGISASASWPT